MADDADEQLYTLITLIVDVQCSGSAQSISKREEYVYYK